MIYGSVCSGIEAATAAWHPLGWKPAFFSEIEPFPRAVLAHHYPDVPLHGDFTTIGEDEYGSIDLLVGGTPCQSFSIAGLRGGLDDDRGNLALEFLKLAQRKRPRWLVWENVPGVLSSNGGRDFGSILGGLVEIGYGFAYRVLDAQYFGVAQRRRRVFVVGYLGDARRAAAVLFERHSLCGNPSPRREAKEGVAGAIARCSFVGGAGGRPDGAAANHFVPARLVSFGEYQIDGTASTLKQRDYKDATDLVACGVSISDGIPKLSDIASTLDCWSVKGRGSSQQQAVLLSGDADCPPAKAFSIMPMNSGKDYKARETDVAQPLMSRSGTVSNQGGDYVCQPSVAFQPRIGRNGRGYSEDVVPALNGADAGATSDMRPCVASPSQVRRLTPRECERLQGFPDDYTAIPWRNKPAEECSDGPRYQALGNSMAVSVMRWIGERISAVDAIP